jgi:hypothetical protein
LNSLLAGVSFENARLQGRWSESGCWQLYLREHARSFFNSTFESGPGWNVSSKSDEKELERAIAKARQVIKDKFTKDGSSKSKSKETKRRGDETMVSNKKLSRRVASKQGASVRNVRRHAAETPKSLQRSPALKRHSVSKRVDESSKVDRSQSLNSVVATKGGGDGRRVLRDDWTMKD